ncbi:sulfotransferase family protein [Rubrivivax gelatinosus]|nr:sulfotransferase [Rubrivivax gelatinosus]
MENLGGSPPAFLVGAGRSGTTLLYKLLAAHPLVGYLNNYLTRLPRFDSVILGNRLLQDHYTLKRRAWFDDRGGAFLGGRRHRPGRWFPTPEECEPFYKRCGFPEMVPSNWVPTAETQSRARRLFGRIRQLNGTPLLLSKRTANNRRIPALHATFPDSRFVVLHRDGRAVAQSLVQVHWWDDHILYWDGRTPRELVRRGADALDLAAQNWAHEVRDMSAGLACIPASQVIYLRYDELLTEPGAQLRRVLTFLGVDPDYSPGYWQLIATLNLRYQGEHWQPRWTAEQRARVEAVQADILAAVGYLGDLR